MSIGRTIGTNFETILKDEAGALAAYTQMIDLAGPGNGSAEYFYCIQGAARVLTRQRKFDDALDVLGTVSEARLPGTWNAAMQLARGETLAAAGRRDAALKVIQNVIDDKTTAKSHRQQALEQKKKLAQ